MKNNQENGYLILWDIDGTLMHCGSDGTKALNRTFSALYGLEDAFSRVGIGRAMDSAILSRLMSEFQIENQELARIRSTYVAFLEEILAASTTKKVLPGIQQLLDYTHNSKNGYHGLLTSNLRAGAEAKLRSVGLDNYFDVGGFGDDLGEKWDAARKGIAEAESHYQRRFPKEQTYLIGDSAYDIQCAKELGIHSIGVATGWMDKETLSSYEPDYLYDDLSDWQQVAFVEKLIQGEKKK